MPHRLGLDHTRLTYCSQACEFRLALRDGFISVAADRHRPAAQIILDLMRLYIAENETPNALTAETLRKSAKGEDVFPVSSLSGLFKQLGI